jgi:putative Mn2+ efflux pump MntP
MVSFDFVVLLIGLVYGYVNPGKEHKTELLKKGLKIGLILGIILALINLFVGGGILLSTATTIGTIVAIGYLTVMFIIGAWVGDILELKFKKK